MQERHSRYTEVGEEDPLLEPEGREEAYDPAFAPPWEQPPERAEGPPPPPPREDIYATADPRMDDPYDRSYRNQAYHFQPPPPHYYAYPPPYVYPYPYAYQQPPPPPNPSLPVAGGVLVVISSILTIIWLLVWTDLWLFPAFDITCVAIGLIFPTLGLIGGICAITRRALVMAIVGAVFAMLSVAFIGVSFVLGLIGLILIAVGYNAFISGGRDPVVR